MAKMLATTQRDKTKRCCEHCVFPDGRYQHGGRKNSRFRKWGRAADKAVWKKEGSDG